MPPPEGEHPGAAHHACASDVSGTVVQVGTVHGSVHLHGDPNTPAGVPVPRQLPVPPRLFTNREAEFRQLEALRRDVAREGSGRTVVLTGTGGVGKTALATRFLESVGPAFPDGALYADLLGFTEAGPADPADVLDTFLRALGADPASIPHDFSARAASFRSRTHGRRIAVLLDNAVSAAQVRALTPGQGGHLLLATTRLHLTGLRLDGAEVMDIRPLGEIEAIELVADLLGDDRTRSDPAATRRLVELCGRLPLALRAAVSGLALRPHQPLNRLVSRLAREGNRLAELSHSRELSVDTVFTASYRLLPEPARRLYRLLGTIPGRDLTAEAAAALLDRGTNETEDLLADLVAANLLEETFGERFRQHDLIRLHARSLSGSEQSETEQSEEGGETGETRETGETVTAAVDRLIDYYLHTAAAADHTLNPGRWHLAPVFERAPGTEFGSRREALDWLESELEVLRATVRFCEATGRYSPCWQLCEALRNVFMIRKHFDAWEETYTAGLASAEALADPAAEANMLNALAGLRLSLGEPAVASQLHHRALAAWTRAGHVLGQASSLEGAGVCELAREQPARARALFEQALAIHTRLGRNRGIALMLRRLGEAGRDLDDHAGAVDYFGRALEFFTEADEPYMRVRTLAGLAATHLAAAEPDRARPVLAEILRLSDRIGAQAEQAGALVLLADLAESEGRIDEARELLSTAFPIYTRLSAPEAERTRSRLDRPPYTSER
ncbi:tetratricopeptide repeat protein [Nocardiopsis exhalans]|uniref:Tetratricopeptide repeat protein n=1 Tax=Nocardiopsis exhalans TaxID=163604 RepID=A0ABY5DCQ5_9ACTN|nr:tetratricopeptide repeat protein [Nocardiopsis exhalans]USY20833.1 tetratricopeptide repeat protein [Nocardiopsis exhalans]